MFSSYQLCAYKKHPGHICEESDFSRLFAGVDCRQNPVVEGMKLNKNYDTKIQ